MTRIVFREASAADIPAISHVRVSVGENLLTRDQLAERGITEASVAASFASDAKGWVASHDGTIVAFSIADRKERTLFALFVLPDYAGRGIGSRLLDLALTWLWRNGAERIWLTTGPRTRAVAFYEKRGWRRVGPSEHGDVRLELERPIGALIPSGG